MHAIEIEMDIISPPDSFTANDIIYNSKSNKHIEEPEILKTQGYKLNIFLIFLFAFLGIISLGGLFLFVYWSPRLRIFLLFTKCTLDSATFVLVNDINNGWSISRIRSSKLDTANISEANNDSTPLISCPAFKYFLFHHARYSFDPEDGTVFRIIGLDYGYTCEKIIDFSRSRTESFSLQYIFGRNSIHVPVDSYPVLAIKEILDPFYIFQIFAIIIWFLNIYYYYAGAVFLISFLSIAISVYEIRKNMIQLRKMVDYSCKITLHRGGKIFTGVSSNDLLPSDTIEIPSDGMCMPCDCVLANGTAIVNESMLTGESVPVFKTTLMPDSNQVYNIQEHKRHTLFGGTEVVQARAINSKVYAVVVRTGYNTSKGNLIRSILFPKPSRLKFQKQSYKFVTFLVGLACIGVVYTIIVNRLSGEDWFNIFLLSSDLITTAVPPSLPAAMTIGIVYALSRLKKHKIFCINPQIINVSGKVKCTCFDKTGTLTVDGLEFYGIVPILEDGMGTLIEDPTTLSISPLIIGLASCHSLTYVNGRLVGDAIDIKMFECVQWSMTEDNEEDAQNDQMVSAIVQPSSNQNKFEVGILQRYPFSSELQRMSVLVRCLPSSSPQDMLVLTKGSPEIIKSLCQPYSIPKNFDDVLNNYTCMGLRVLALAWKEIKLPWHKIQRTSRQQIECDLNLAGFILMENKLKPETMPTIQMLHNVDIRTIMITGDNLLTGINIAKQCSIIDRNMKIMCINISHPNVNTNEAIDDKIQFTYMEDTSLQKSNIVHSKSDEAEIRSDSTFPYCYVIDGNTFDVIHNTCGRDMLQKVILKCAVYARMSPKQKAIVVEELQKLEYVVLMCGDGANDCQALKTADVGVSLSDSEASIAAPFTSKIRNISCVPNVIREGRAALATSFGIFKFMALYCFIEFTTVVLLYWWLINLGDWQYLYIDLLLIFSIGLTMGYTKPHKTLTSKRPSANLMNPVTLMSVLSQCVISVSFQLGAYFLLASRIWYTPLAKKLDFDHFAVENVRSSENSVLFTFSTFQYLGVALAFSIGPPYRKMAFNNIWFLLCFVFFLTVSIFITYAPYYENTYMYRFYDFIQLADLQSWTFKLGLILYALCNIIVCEIFEDYVIQTILFRRIVHFFTCKKRQKNLYKRLLLEM